MKKIACAAALVASLTAPAFAQNQGVGLGLGGVSAGAAAAGLAGLLIIVVAANGSDNASISTTISSR